MTLCFKKIHKPKHELIIHERFLYKILCFYSSITVTKKSTFAARIASRVSDFREIAGKIENILWGETGHINS